MEYILFRHLEGEENPIVAQGLETIEINRVVSAEKISYEFQIDNKVIIFFLNFLKKFEVFKKKGEWVFKVQVINFINCLK